MSTAPEPVTTTPAPAASTTESFLEKIWGWLKGKVVIVENDLSELLGPKAAGELEAIGKTMLSTWLGPLATAAIADATDVVTGAMSVSKAMSTLVSSASSSGKTVSQAAALQAIALVHNVLPVSTGDGTVTPS